MPQRAGPSREKRCKGNRSGGTRRSSALDPLENTIRRERLSAGIQFDGVRAVRFDAAARATPRSASICPATLDRRPAPASNRAMPMKDPDWLAWARELQAIAQTGLTFCRDPYDRERYEAIRATRRPHVRGPHRCAGRTDRGAVRRRDRLCDPQGGRPRRRL